MKVTLVTLLAGSLVTGLEAAPSSEIRLNILAPFSNARAPDDCKGESNFYNGTSYPRCMFGDAFQAITTGGLLAIHHFNTRDGTVIEKFANLGSCDKQITARAYDTGLSPALIIESVLDMLQDKNNEPHLVIGPATSSGSVASSLITGVYKIPQISYWSTSSQLDNEKEYPYFMRTIPTDAAVAKATCLFWSAQGFRFGAMIYVSDNYGESYKEAMVKYCGELSIQVTSFPFVPGSTEAQYREQVVQMAELQLNVFLLVSTNDGVSEILSAANDLGMLGDGKAWFFSDGVNSEAFAGVSYDIGKKLDGSIRIIASGGVDSNPVWTRFKTSWSSFDPAPLNTYLPDHWKLSSTFFQTFDPMDTMVKDVGAYMYDAIAMAAVLACEIQETGPLPNDFGETFRSLAKESTFNGLTGRVEFDAVGNRDVTTANYQLYNLKASEAGAGTGMEYTLVAAYNNIDEIWEEVEGEKIRFNPTGNAVKDLDEPVHDFQQSSVVQAFCYLLFGVNILTATVFLTWTILNRKHAVVRASQTKFLALVALGGMISSTSIVFVAQDDAGMPLEMYAMKNETALSNVASLDFACNASVWFFSLGFVLSYSSLACKIFRVKKIFTNRSLKKIKITNGQLFTVMGICSLIDIAILAAWGASAPLSFERVIQSRNRFGFPLRSAGQCVSDNSTTFLILLGVFHFFLLFIGNYYAYLTRNVHTAFSEGKYVSIAMVSTLQVYALAIPILIIASDNPSSNMFLRSGVVFLSDFSVMCLVFVPKIIAVVSGLEEKTSLIGSKSAATTVMPTTNTSNSTK